MTNDQITDSIRKAIINGEFKRGGRIVQEDLAKHYGVSRMPIREALKRLEFEGLVKNEPSKGAVAYPITIEDIEEIYTLRSMNESLAAMKALPYISSQDIKLMEDILTKMEALKLTEETQDYYASIHRDYHKLIIDKCPWRRLKQNTLIHWDHYLAIASPMILKKYYHKAQLEHRQIYEAILSGNEEVLKQIIEYHTLRNKKDLITSMREDM